MVRRKGVIRGRERWTVRNSCSEVVIWTLSVRFWNSYAERLNLNMSVSVPAWLGDWSAEVPERGAGGKKEGEKEREAEGERERENTPQLYSQASLGDTELRASSLPWPCYGHGGDDLTGWTAWPGAEWRDMFKGLQPERAEGAQVNKEGWLDPDWTRQKKEDNFSSHWSL